MDIDIQELINELPSNLKSFVALDNPRDKRLLAARAVIPLVPKDLVRVLFVLAFDEDEEIRNEASASLKEIPEGIMKDIISDHSMHPAFLDYVARNLDNEKYNQTILLNKSTYDSTFVYLARNEDSSANLEIIANNKKRILSSDEIVEALSNNPAVSRSTLDEVLSFLNLHLNSGEHIKQNAASDTETDNSYEDENGASDIVEEEEWSGDSETQEYDESFFNDYEVDNEYIEEKEQDPNEVVRESAFSMIQTLRMGEKLKIALQGNMEARKILIKDNNKLISGAVLKNPRLTDMEVILICQSKVVDDEILRKISETRKWTRLYQVKASLVNNPKTPVHISMNLLRHLREHDLRRIMVDRNLPGAVANAARNIVRSKK